MIFKKNGARLDEAAARMGKAGIVMQREPAGGAPLALLYGLPEDTPAGGAARAVFAGLGVAVREVTAQQLLYPAGTLAGYGGPPGPRFFGKAPEEPALLMAGFSRAMLDTALDALRESGVSVPLKAVLTPHNQGWSMLELIGELRREHAATHPR